jgi:hypothetical protein
MRSLRNSILVSLVTLFANATLLGQPVDSIVGGKTYLTPLPKTYVCNHKENVYTIHLYRDSCFEYYLQTKEYSIKYFGKYKITNDTIYLNFHKSNESEENINNSDSETIQICNKLISRKEKLLCDGDKRVVFRIKKRIYFIK